jgi:hypothetical protein
MDHKLDVIIEKLDQLDEKITTQHYEVMNALESISFDVNRSLDMIRDEQVRAFSRKCEEAVAEDRKLPPATLGKDIVDCSVALSPLNLSLDSHEKFFYALYNVKTKNLTKTAKEELDRLQDIYTKSQDFAGPTCFNLTLAAYSLHEVSQVERVGQKQASTKQESAMCNQVLSFAQLIDPGVISFFSSLDISLADRSKQLPIADAKRLIWKEQKKAESRIVLRDRWIRELRMVNASIGQQARLSGDFTVPDWAKKLDLVKPLDAKEIAILDQNEVLARNTLRYWLWQHIRDKSSEELHMTDTVFPSVSNALQFAFAYQACSPQYLQLLTITKYGADGMLDFEKTKHIDYRWTPDVLDNTRQADKLQIDDTAHPPDPCPTKKAEDKRWCALFEGLHNCILLPTPEEEVSGTWQKTDDLEALLNIRDRLLTLIETTDMINNLTASKKDLLIKAFVMKWGADKKRTTLELQDHSTPGNVAVTLQTLN